MSADPGVRSRGQSCKPLTPGGSDRSEATFRAKANSFVKLAGDPAQGVKGGVMAHALRTTGSSACNIALVACGQLDMYWCVALEAKLTSGMRAAGRGMFAPALPFSKRSAAMFQEEWMRIATTIQWKRS